MKLVVISSSLNPVSRFLLDNYSVIGVVESLPGYFSPIALRLRDIYLAFRNQSLKRYARKRNAAFYRLKKGDTSEFQNWLTRLNPDLVVVY
ncbi:MAG: hypothetical protein NZM65_08050, partial [Flavobacteriales bacterium]|nr:hypothetical protein [Flavobacteriales bacterium]MDW8410623.1 hypothetical protein [Flavobacteriales bacterium]